MGTCKFLAIVEFLRIESYWFNITMSAAHPPVVRLQLENSGFDLVA